jgi:hypothetical protein
MSHDKNRKCLIIFNFSVCYKKCFKCLKMLSKAEQNPGFCSNIIFILHNQFNKLYIYNSLKQAESNEKIVSTYVGFTILSYCTVGRSQSRRRINNLCSEPDPKPESYKNDALCTICVAPHRAEICHAVI